MARSRLAFAIGTLILIAGMVACSPPQAATTTQGDPAAEIIAREREMEALYNDPRFPTHPDIVHSYFAPTYSIIDIMQPGRFEGAAATQHSDSIAAQFVGRVEFRNLDVHASGDQGYVDYIQYFVGTDAAGHPFEMNLYCTDIWQKIDGQWLIVHQHVTLPMDHATLIQVMTPTPH